MSALLLLSLACTTDEDRDTPSCDAWLACVAAALPEELAVAEASYGETGACWGQGDDYDALCEASCESLQTEAAVDNPDVEACEAGPHEV